MKRLVVCCCYLLFSCQKENPQSVFLKCAEISNHVVRGDTTDAAFLKSHLSKASLAKVEKTPMLLAYSLISFTKKGTLVTSTVLSQQIIAKDSVILNLALTYKDSTTSHIAQAMVYEDNCWKLGISAKE